MLHLYQFGLDVLAYLTTFDDRVLFQQAFCEGRGKVFFCLSIANSRTT